MRRDTLREMIVTAGSTTTANSVSRQLIHSRLARIAIAENVLRITFVMTPVVLCITFCASNTIRDTRLDDECASK